ncbi:Solute carrier family 35 member G1 [Nymphon striatum]|nr:Solute carrier family 35 member G1 [Nymphon striatum]
MNTFWPSNNDKHLVEKLVYVQITLDLYSTVIGQVTRDEEVSQLGLLTMPHDDCSHDTDAMVALLNRMPVFPQHNLVRLGVRAGVRNTTRYGPLHTLYELLGCQLSAILPTVHSLTRCNINSKVGIKKAALKAGPEKSLQNFGKFPTLIMPTIRNPEGYLVKVLRPKSNAKNISDLGITRLNTCWEANLAYALDDVLFSRTNFAETAILFTPSLYFTHCKIVQSIVIMNLLKRPGVLLSLAAAVLFGLSTVFEGIVSRDIGPDTSLALANIFRAYIALPVMLWRMSWVQTSTREWILLIISSTLLVALLYCYIDSNRRIPPVDVVSIYQLEFIIIAIIAHFWLKEYLGIYEIILMIIIIIGVGFVCQPTFIFNPSKLHETTYGYIEALAAALFAATSHSIIRRLQNIDPFFMCVIQGMIGSALILPVAFYEFKSPKTESVWMYALLGGFLSGIYNILLVICLSMEDGALVMAIQATGVIYTLVFQILFMNVYPNWISIFGTVIVTGGISFLSTLIMDFLKRPGILFALVAAVLNSLNTIFEGIVSREIGPDTSLALAVIFRAYLALPVMLWRKNWVETNRSEWILTIISSTLLVALLYCYIDSNRRIPPVDVVAIYQLEFIMVAIIVHFWLKEYLGIYEIILMIIVIIGVGLVCQPEFIFNPSELQKTLNTTYGYIEAFAAAIMGATSHSIIRRLQNIDPFFLCVMQGMVGSALYVPVAFYGFKSPETEYVWTYALLGGLTSGIYNISLVIALSFEDGALVMAIQASSVIYTLVFQIPFMKIYPNWISILGSVIVTGGISFLILKKHIFKVCIRRRMLTESDQCLLRYF